MRGVVGNLRWMDTDEGCGGPFVGVVGGLRVWWAIFGCGWQFEAVGMVQ